MEINKENKKSQIKRRDMLKVLGAAPAAALVTIRSAQAEPMPAMPGMPAATQAAPAAGPYKLQYLTEHEYKTVAVLSDWIIPADEKSGSATQAGVPEFIDDWLEFKKTVPSMSQDGERYSYSTLAEEIRGGLTWLDIECNRQFGNDFVDCSKAQQQQMLDRIAYPKRAARHDATGVRFFNHLRDLVVGGFFSSKMGVQDLQYMGNTMVAEWKGCPDNVLAHLNISYNDEANNAYKPEFGIRAGGLVGDTKTY
jgi:hypothetical protein